MSVSLVQNKEQIISWLTEGENVVVFDTHYSEDVKATLTMQADLVPNTDLENSIKQTKLEETWHDELPEDRENNVSTAISVYNTKGSYWMGICCTRIKSINGISITYSN